MGFSRFVGIAPSLALGNRRVGRVGLDGLVGHVGRVGFVGLVGLVGLLPQCSSDAVGIDACRKVEEARCRRAKECGLPLATPPAVGDEVEACIRFYKDACLRGLTSKTDPGEPGVLACVEALRTLECAVVQRPETTPACAFLQPATPDAGPGILDAQPNAPPDGGSDAANIGTGNDASHDGSAVSFGLDAG